MVQRNTADHVTSSTCSALGGAFGAQRSDDTKEKITFVLTQSWTWDQKQPDHSAIKGHTERQRKDGAHRGLGHPLYIQITFRAHVTQSERAPRRVFVRLTADFSVCEVKMRGWWWNGFGLAHWDVK